MIGPIIDVDSYSVPSEPSTQRLATALVCLYPNSHSSLHSYNRSECAVDERERGNETWLQPLRKLRKVERETLEYRNREALAMFSCKSSVGVISIDCKCISCRIRMAASDASSMNRDSRLAFADTSLIGSYNLIIFCLLRTCAGLVRRWLRQ